MEQGQTSVVVFGAGEAGRRALERLRRDASVRVAAFADNDAARHGTLYQGLPIVGPDALLDGAFDRVVVASHAVSAIVPQLRGLGVPAERIDVFQIGPSAIEPSATSDESRPRLLVLSDECIAPSHGTGAVLLRHFADYPKDRLIHAYLRRRGDAFLPHSYPVALERDVDAAAVGSAGERVRAASHLVAEIQAQHGRIDLVYSNFYGEAGLLVLRELLASLDPAVPVVHHVHDLLTPDDARFDALLAEVAPRISEFWAIGPGLAARVAGLTGRPVEPMNTFSCPITPTFKREHRDLDAGFTAVMLGNAHMPWVLDRLRPVWAEIRAAFGVGPIRWFAYPTSFLQVEHAGVRLDPDIEYYGYLGDRALHRQLCDADLALVPFNVEDEPEAGYARYSIPSRLTEFLNAGLPIFAAAGANTETARFITGNAIGRCSTLARPDAFAADLVALMRDRIGRQTLGHGARRFAVHSCDVTRYRAKLLSRIEALAGLAGRPAHAVAPHADAAPAPAAPSAPAPTAIDPAACDRIHYACGRRVLDGWLNVDAFDDSYPGGRDDLDTLAGRIHRMNLTSRHPFADNAFQWAYSEDFLEHVTQADSIIFLSEAYRTLRPGGVLRISTPSLPGVLRRHHRASDYAGAVACRDEAYTMWHHLHFYAFESLELVARHIGFSKVTRCEYGKGEHPELLLESRFNQADLNLVVELTK